MTNEVNMNKPSFEDLLSKPIHINKNKDEDKKDKHNKEEKKLFIKNILIMLRLYMMSGAIE